MLLDAGSQILDLLNPQVARTWLKIARDVAGAIYFNEIDELMVLTPSSALSEQLGRCVVYLDHTHTRGTDCDLKLGHGQLLHWVLMRRKDTEVPTYALAP